MPRQRCCWNAGPAVTAKTGMICGYISAGLGVVILIIYIAVIGIAISQG